MRAGVLIFLSIDKAMERKFGDDVIFKPADVREFVGPCLKLMVAMGFLLLISICHCLSGKQDEENEMGRLI